MSNQKVDFDLDFVSNNDTILLDYNSFNINNLDIHENEFLVNLQQQNKEINFNIDEEGNNPKISSDDYVYTLSLKINGFENEKELMKFTKKIKQTVRNSYEYKLWVDYIKNVLLYNNCAFTGENSSELTIDIHHHPICMEDIILCVINKKLNNNEEFSSFDIASEVIYLHYKMKVGCVPLITSLHEKYHNGFLEIPIDFCVGDWRYLIDNYVFDEEKIKEINKKISINSNNYIFEFKKTNFRNKI